MIDFERTFLDSSFFIYHIEDDPRFAATTAKYALNALAKERMLCTSVVSVMEFSTKPLAIARHDLLDKFKDFLREFKITACEIDLVCANKATQLRAKYNGLKGLDAFQIATAIEQRCDAFLTNDTRLKRIKEVNVVLINDLVQELSQHN
jgi:predicted nucleic acid-binding protein